MVSNKVAVLVSYLWELFQPQYKVQNKSDLNEETICFILVKIYVFLDSAHFSLNGTVILKLEILAFLFPLKR